MKRTCNGHVGGEPNIVYIEFKCGCRGGGVPLDSNTPAVRAHGVRFGARRGGGLPWKQVHVGLLAAADVVNKGLTTHPPHSPG